MWMCKRCGTPYFHITEMEDGDKKYITIECVCCKRIKTIIKRVDYGQ